jgi:hypothetical protein
LFHNQNNVKIIVPIMALIILKYPIMRSRMEIMNGFTIAEIAEKLGIATDTAKRRLQRAGIKPVSYAGPTGIYDKSAMDAIRDSAGPGRPPKAKK